MQIHSITADQIRHIHAMLPPVIKNDPEQKKELIYQFTNDYNKVSTKDLTFTQANELIIRFGGSPHSYDNWAFFDIKKTSHRTILSLCMQLDWTVWNEQKKQTVADLYRLSEWLKTKSPVKKKLKRMTPKEVSKVIYAMEQIIKKRYKEGEF